MKARDPVALVAVLCLLGACSTDSLPPPAPDSTRQLATGAVVGFADRHDTWSWLGIPFAQAPVGDLRWRAPRPPQPWEGTLEALSFGPVCPQFPLPIVNDTSETMLGQEDCLYLNVSAPRDWSPGNPPLPVMVWLHGGGNVVGSADLYAAVRNLAAQQRVVTVSIHYRLGALGWFSHPALRDLASDPLDASGNFGTLDTVAALRWVQENIAAFGGDPGAVTVFGESSGGMNTYALLLSPLAKSLFHRAISQSGMLVSTPVAYAENPVDAGLPGHHNSSHELLLRLLQADDRAVDRAGAAALAAGWDSATIMAFLRSRSPLQLLEQMARVENGFYQVPMLLRDGVVLPEGEPLALLTEGAFNRVPVILGTNRDEMKTMMIRHPDYTRLRFGLLPQVRDQDLYDRVTGYGSAMWKAVGADEPARAMAAAGHRDVYVYRFDWDEVPSNWLLDLKSLLGAAHSFEIPFVFNDVDNEMTFLPFDLIDEDNLAGAGQLAAAMSSYWGRFAHTGNPHAGSGGDLPRWSSWEDQGSFMVLDEPAGGGIRMQSGGLDRDAVFEQLAGDGTGLGGQESLCRAYRNLFEGEEAFFSFIASCPGDTDCPGSANNFCL